MLILVTYDVNTKSEEGEKRLRRVAKCCVRYGQRVQNSVFECVLNEAQYKAMQNQLIKIIDETKDSLRFYNLGNKYKDKTMHIGIKQGYSAEGILML